jgi:hypothetical protein
MVCGSSPRFQKPVFASNFYRQRREKGRESEEQRLQYWEKFELFITILLNKQLKANISKAPLPPLFAGFKKLHLFALSDYVYSTSVKFSNFLDLAMMHIKLHRVGR